MPLAELVHGCTFDDILLAPQFSVVESRDPASIDLRSSRPTWIR
jgi:IMP dehydrogenase/GMP reductase